MLKWLAKFFGSAADKITNYVWPDSREIDYTSQRWGHELHIGTSWSAQKKFNLTGHYFGRGLLHDKGINEGDVLLIAMNGGKIGMLRVYSITWFRDPNDMFSATVMFEGVKD